MYVHFHLILFAFAFVISNTPYQKRWRLVHQPIILQILIKTQRKSSKNFKPSINNVDSTGTNFTKKNLAFYVPIGCVRFARYCGKIYNRHVNPYGGLLF